MRHGEAGTYRTVAVEAVRQLGERIELKGAGAIPRNVADATGILEHVVIETRIASPAAGRSGRHVVEIEYI